MTHVSFYIEYILVHVTEKRNELSVSLGTEWVYVPSLLKGKKQEVADGFLLMSLSVI